MAFLLGLQRLRVKWIPCLTRRLACLREYRGVESSLFQSYGEDQSAPPERISVFIMSGSGIQFTSSPFIQKSLVYSNLWRGLVGQIRPRNESHLPLVYEMRKVSCPGFLMGLSLPDCVMSIDDI